MKSNWKWKASTLEVVNFTVQQIGSSVTKKKKQSCSPNWSAFNWTSALKWKTNFCHHLTTKAVSSRDFLLSNCVRSFAHSDQQCQNYRKTDFSSFCQRHGKFSFLGSARVNMDPNSLFLVGCSFHEFEKSVSIRWCFAWHTAWPAFGHFVIGSSKWMDTLKCSCTEPSCDLAFFRFESVSNFFSNHCEFRIRKWKKENN